MVDGGGRPLPIQSDQRVPESGDGPPRLRSTRHTYPPMSDPFDIRGRVAVVTGGYGVLGGTIATDLAAAGARVAIVGRRLELAQKRVEEIVASGGEAIAVM